jgi:hypothetical protein
MPLYCFIYGNSANNWQKIYPSVFVSNYVFITLLQIDILAGNTYQWDKWIWRISLLYVFNVLFVQKLRILLDKNN